MVKLPRLKAGSFLLLHSIKSAVRRSPGEHVCENTAWFRGQSFSAAVYFFRFAVQHKLIVSVDVEHQMIVAAPCDQTVTA